MHTLANASPKGMERLTVISDCPPSHLMRILAIASIPLLLLLLGCSPSDGNGGGTSSSSSSSRSSVSSISSSSSSQSSYPALSRADQQKVEAYIGANLMIFAKTTPSTLNGSFAVTEVEWYTENSAIVTFEDEEKIIQARMTATVNGNTVNVVQFTEFSVEDK